MGMGVRKPNWVYFRAVDLQQLNNVKLHKNSTKAIFIRGKTGITEAPRL